MIGVEGEGEGEGVAVLIIAKADVVFENRANKPILNKDDQWYFLIVLLSETAAA
jgi:hypothetical protein